MWPTEEKPYFGIFVEEQVNDFQLLYPSTQSKLINIKGYKSWFNYFISVISINFHLLFNKYDIIHIHFGLSGLFLLFRIRRKKNIILTLHGSDINIESSNKIKVWITQQIIKRVDYVICVNKEMVNKIKQFNNVKVIPCGINTSLFVPDKQERKKDSIRIIFPSNIGRPEKKLSTF